MTPAVDPQGQFQLGPWRVDPSDGRLTDGQHEERLEPKLLRILQLLVAAGGDVLDRNALFDGVWPNQIIADQTLDSAISRLRSKLGDDPKSPQFILTVPKRGYRLLLPALPVSPTEVAASAGAKSAEERVGTARGLAANLGAESMVRSRLIWNRPVVRWLAGFALATVIGPLFLVLHEPGQDAELAPPTVASSTMPLGEAASVAVLPFVNMSDDPDTGHFSDGIAEELLNQLTRVDGLQVASRTSSFRFRERQRDVLPDLMDIGRQLRVRYVVEGSVRRVNDDLRITVQLIDAADGFHRWSHTYEQRWESIFDLQAAMTRDIVEKIAPKMLPSGLDPMLSRAADSASAYERYLLGRHYWHQRQPESLQKAIAYFEEALAIQPDYALALTGLAETYLAMVPYGGLQRSQALARAEPLLARALSLAPNLAESRLALGHLHFLRAEWAAAETELRKSLALNRNLAMAHMLLGNVYNDTGRLDEAYASYREALARDPLHATVLMNLAQASLKLGMYARATRYLEAAKQLFPTHTYLFGLHAHIAIASGDTAAASALLTDWQIRQQNDSRATTPGDPLACGMLSVFLQRWLNAEACLRGVLQADTDDWLQGSARMLALNHLAVVEAHGGRNDQAREWAGEAILLSESDAPGLAQDESVLYERAVAHALRDEPDLALENLRKSIENGRRDTGWIRHDRRLASIMSLPEFDVLLVALESSQATLRERVLQRFPDAADIQHADLNAVPSSSN